MSENSSPIRTEFPKRKTKIVVTLGPSSNSPETIRELILAGMNVVRLNFSHGTHEDHFKVLSIVREESKKLGKTLAVFQDLCGPKVRIGLLKNAQITLVDGQRITLKHFDGSEGDNETIYVEAFDPVKVLNPGEKALLADGKIEIVAVKVTEGAVECSVTSGGMLRSRSGIAVPESKLNLNVITEKDIKDVKWAVENDLDYVALSFVRSARDIESLRKIMAGYGKVLPIIAKIERAEALDHIEEIARTSNAVMIARGDLGLELPLERVPGAQKLIMDQANFHGTPVITATQMLLSMVNEVRPTRAEVTDVHTAVRDGTDAVMLSDETAIGKHPINVVKVLDRIICAVEREFEDDIYRTRLKSQDRATIPDAICFAATSAAAKISAAAIVVCTQSGASARLISKYRPRHPIYAITTDARTMAKLSLNWGVTAALIDLPDEASHEDEISTALTAARGMFGLKPGSRVVITAGLRFNQKGSTTALQIREIPRTV